MARPLRPEVDNGFWHVWNRGNEKQDIFRSDADRIRFRQLLAETVRRFRWNLISWVWMTNHFHLAIETSTANLTRGMHWLECSYVMWFNRKYQRVGYLFQGRFKSALVEDDSYLRELVRYVVLNPVRAGMVDHPSKYGWSSYPALAGLEPTPAWLDDRWLCRLEPDPTLRREKYREFIEEKIGCKERLWDRFVGQIYFGSRVWIESMQTVVDLNPPSDEHTYLQSNAGKPEMAQVICERCGRSLRPFGSAAPGTSPI